MSQSLPSAESVTELLRTRRTIGPPGMDPDRDVAREAVALLLENATWAPTHGMTEPWRFVVYSGAARERLAAALQSIYAATTAAESFDSGKQHKLGVVTRRAPVTIAICMARDPSGRIPEVEEIEAVACAVQNMHLTATALGLAAKWSSPAVAYTRPFADWLGLGPEDRCLGFFYVGHPAGDWPRSRRRPVDEVVRWETEEG